MGPAVKPKAGKGIFYGWWIVLSNAAISYYIGGTYFYGFSAFFEPIRETFRWTYAQTSAGFSLQQLEAGVAAPLTGVLADRLGPRKIIFFGCLIMGLAFILFSRVDSLLSFYAAFILLSLGLSGSSYGIAYVAAAHWFRRKLGLALGVVTTGMGLCGTLLPVVVWLISSYGWRTALIIVGVGMWVIALPLSLVIRHRPEPYGYLPDGEEPRATSPRATTALPEEERSFTLKEALRSRAYWHIAGMMACTQLIWSAIFVHIIPYLESVGVAKSTAAWAVAALTVLSLVGRLGFGWWADRMDKRHGLALSAGLASVGVLVLAAVSQEWHVIIFLLIFSPGYGGVMPLRPALQREYFGAKAFGSIQGVMMGTITVTGFLSPLMVGYLRDVTGDYRLGLVLVGLLSLLAVPIILTAKRPGMGKAAG